MYINNDVVECGLTSWIQLGERGGSNENLIFIKFGRTDLRRGVSGAKFNAEADFEVRLAVALQKPSKNCEKLVFRSKIFAEKKNRPRKIKCRGSSETRFGKVWSRTELCLRGKRLFEVSKKIEIREKVYTWPFKNLKQNINGHVLAVTIIATKKRCDEMICCDAE